MRELVHENQSEEEEEEETRELNHFWAGSNIAISHTMIFQSRNQRKKVLAAIRATMISIIILSPFFERFFILGGLGGIQEKNLQK